MIENLEKIIMKDITKEWRNGQIGSFDRQRMRFRVLQDIMRHKRAKTTMLYTKPSRDERREDHRRFLMEIEV